MTVIRISTPEPAAWTCAQAKAIKSMEVTWAGSHTRQVLTNVSMDQFYRLQEDMDNSGLISFPRTNITFGKGGMLAHHHNM